MAASQGARWTAYCSSARAQEAWGHPTSDPATCADGRGAGSEGNRRSNRRLGPYRDLPCAGGPARRPGGRPRHGDGSYPARLAFVRKSVPREALAGPSDGQRDPVQGLGRCCSAAPGRCGVAPCSRRVCQRRRCPHRGLPDRRGSPTSSREGGSPNEGVGCHLATNAIDAGADLSIAGGPQSRPGSKPVAARRRLAGPKVLRCSRHKRSWEPRLLHVQLAANHLQPQKTWRQATRKKRARPRTTSPPTTC